MIWKAVVSFFSINLNEETGHPRSCWQPLIIIRQARQKANLKLQETRAKKITENWSWIFHWTEPEAYTPTKTINYVSGLTTFNF